jgi:hypothetical protein
LSRICWFCLSGSQGSGLIDPHLHGLMVRYEGN